MMKNWRKIPCLRTELNLEPTLNGGQSFRWKKSDEGVWRGVIQNKVWELSQTDDSLLYQCYKSVKNEQSHECGKPKKRKMDVIDDDDEELVLKKYFRLDVDLNKFYGIWSESDEHFKQSANKLYGIRMLDQEVVENLFSFICSSNNNIARISKMVEKLCSLYGSEITRLDGNPYYSFPSIEKLCSPSVESDLRNAGFGYRAKFIHQSASMIKEFGGEKWLNSLKSVPYLEAKRELMKLSGIGAKVADCICLMSLSHLEAIPVDTHIFQVASQFYLPHLKGCKSVTEKVYNEISSHFQELYKQYAGWAHTILFCSQLKAFQEGKPNKKKKQNVWRRLLIRFRFFQQEGKKFVNVLLVYCYNHIGMPQTYYVHWDRIFLLKIIATTEMTVSSILLLLYCYLYLLQDWTSSPDTRYNVLGYRWLIFASTAVDFVLGSFLAYATNLANKYRRPKVILWIIFDSLLLPLNVYLLRRMSFELENSTSLSSDLHLMRTLLVHKIYVGCHFAFIMAAINFLAYHSPKIAKYNPFARPDSVFETTDPQITTTESRHIRFSDSFLQTDSRRNTDVEASPSASGSAGTSIRSQMLLRTKISDNFRHHRLSPVPLIAAYWLKRLPRFLDDPRRKLANESKGTEALKQIRKAHPDIYKILARVWEIKVMVGWKKPYN